MAINKAMRAALKAISYPDLNVKKNYQSLRQVKNIASPKLHFYKTWDHKVVYGGHEIPVRLFAPPESPAGLLVFFHGGGWVTGNIDSYTRVCAYMARRTGRLVLSVDYRLAPEHRFPAALEDCYAVAKEVSEHAAIFGMEPEQIALIGDSAGANLTAAVSLMARDRGEFLPSAQILIYPATYFDHSKSSPFRSVHQNGTGYLLTSKRLCDYMDLYQSKPEDRLNPYFAPLLAETLENQPRTLIITAQYDPLRDEGEAYARRLAEDGNTVELHRIADALHGFFTLPPRFIHVKRAYGYINHFLNMGETQ